MLPFGLRSWDRQRSIAASAYLKSPMYRVRFFALKLGITRGLWFGRKWFAEGGLFRDSLRRYIVLAEDGLQRLCCQKADAYPPSAANDWNPGVRNAYKRGPSRTGF